MNFDALTTPELTRMRDRAYREAVRSWREYSAARDDGTLSVRPILMDSAMEADRWYALVRDAVAQRPDKT